MKSDIDRLMAEADLDALLVIGSALHNPFMGYFTGPRNVTQAYLIKLRGQAPLLFHTSMEREEAAATGLETKSLEDYPWKELIEQSGGDRRAAVVLRLQRIFADCGVSGRVAVYGKVELGEGFGTMKQLEAALGDIELIGEPLEQAVLTKARMTKDEQEVEQIRRMGKIATSVVADVADFLSSHQLADGTLVNRNGERLTVGEVKRRIQLWLAMRGAEIPEGIIFSAGRDTGIPHNAGRDSQPVEIGQPLILDLWPTVSGGGHFFDFTRTWAVGRASQRLQQLHQDVLEVYTEVFEHLRLGAPCREMQILACQAFEARGHATVLNSPNTQQGYVHSLAHGVGLNIHEPPSFWHHESNQDTLAAGTVFTFEPGLYYPDEAMGVRLEDTVWARPDGSFEILADYPKDLVLKLPGA